MLCERDVFPSQGESGPTGIDGDKGAAGSAVSNKLSFN